MSARLVTATHRRSGISYAAVQDTETGAAYPFPEFIAPLAVAAFNLGVDDLSRYRPLPNPEAYDLKEVTR